MSTENENEAAVWNIKMSRIAEKSESPFSGVVDAWRPHPDKEVISLATGDPLTHDNIKPSNEVTNAVVQTISEGTHNGYAPSVGYESARSAIADFLYRDGIETEAKDIIICGGCSSALDLCITVLVDETKNHNILIPKPGIPLYRIFAESLGVEVRQYDLLPENNWEIDPYDLEAKIDSNTAAIIVNNPSNPCGSVYSAEHLREILKICYRHKVPVIADELHGQIIHANHKYTSLATLGTPVPILLCGGLSQAFLVPGWRVGWIVIQDPIGAFEIVKKGLISLSQRIIGCNTVMQGSLMNILHSTPHSYTEDLVNTIGENARMVFDELQEINGLTPYMPQGTIFMIIKINAGVFNFEGEVEFLRALCEEESVKCLPLDGYGLPGFMRIILCAPNTLVQEAVERLKTFCQRHYK